MIGWFTRKKPPTVADYLRTLPRMQRGEFRDFVQVNVYRLPEPHDSDWGRMALTGVAVDGEVLIHDNVDHVDMRDGGARWNLDFAADGQSHGIYLLDNNRRIRVKCERVSTVMLVAVEVDK